MVAANKALVELSCYEKSSTEGGVAVYTKKAVRRIMAIAAGKATEVRRRTFVRYAETLDFKDKKTFGQPEVLEFLKLQRFLQVSPGGHTYEQYRNLMGIEPYPDFATHWHSRFGYDPNETASLQEVIKNYESSRDTKPN